MEESADDITAADTAPKPIKEMILGVRYWMTRGRTSLGSLTGKAGSGMSVLFQSVNINTRQKKKTPLIL